MYVHADNHWGGIDMWASLRKKIDKEPIDALLHCGDQVGQGCDMWRREYSVPDAATTGLLGPRDSRETHQTIDPEKHSSKN